MKKRYFILVIICIFLCSGCGKVKSKNTLELTCKNTIDSEIEKVQTEEVTISFYSSNKAKKTVTIMLEEGEVTGDEMSMITESLRQNYCNSEIKEDYECNLTTSDIGIVEKGKTKVLMGEVEDHTISEYQKMLEEKGFTCSKKK